MSEFEILRELLRRDRTIRRFDQLREISPEDLRSLVELTRYCASGRNLQPLKYRIVTDPEERERLFPLLAWAGYLEDWEGPAEGERPAAYLIQCLDTRLTQNCLCDDGLQLQAITLGATASGIGGCIIKSFNMVGVREVLQIPDWARIQCVLALGFPKEKVVIEDYSGDIKYFRTDDGVHHVPKRMAEDLFL